MFYKQRAKTDKCMIIVNEWEEFRNTKTDQQKWIRKYLYQKKY